MTKIRIRVTEKDIREGDRFKTNSCPIARAMKRKLRYASVDCFGYRLWNNGRIHRFPKSNIGSWITSFDIGRQVLPFSFTIEVPDNMLRTPS